MTKDQFIMLWKRAGSGNISALITELFLDEYRAGFSQCIVNNGNPRISKNPHMGHMFSKTVSPKAMAWNYGWNVCWEERYYPIQKNDPEPYHDPSNCI